MIKFLKELWLIIAERAKCRKAIRILSKQEWSTEFLVYLINKAASARDKGVFFTLEHRNGDKLIIHASTSAKNWLAKEKELDVLQRNVSLDTLMDAAQIRGML